ncbi:MAG: sigma-70 family RNA polymerase sigma factor [Gammaproteobacteria bacterium]|nr:sigma-70 family RNA polymerase sigma factor [Gammaproteobacteria bacterium]
MTESGPSPKNSLNADDLAACRPALLRYARLQVREMAVAEDLVQNTLIAALQSVGNFRGEAAPVTWLIGILKRQIIDHHRRAAREVSLPTAADGDDGNPDLLERLFAQNGHWVTKPAVWADPEQSLRQEAFLSVLEQCLKGLAGQSGRVFAMREILELEPPEICKDLGLTQSNYWVLMHRARLRLRQCVERGWITDGPRDN